MSNEARKAAGGVLSWASSQNLNLSDAKRLLSERGLTLDGHRRLGGQPGNAAFDEELTTASKEREKTTNTTVQPVYRDQRVAVSNEHLLAGSGMSNEGRSAAGGVRSWASGQNLILSDAKRLLSESGPTLDGYKRLGGQPDNVASGAEVNEVSSELEKEKNIRLPHKTRPGILKNKPDVPVGIIALPTDSLPEPSVFPKRKKKTVAWPDLPQRSTTDLGVVSIAQGSTGNETLNRNSLYGFLQGVLGSGGADMGSELIRDAAKKDKLIDDDGRITVAGTARLFSMKSERTLLKAMKDMQARMEELQGLSYAKRNKLIGDIASEHGVKRQELLKYVKDKDSLDAVIINMEKEWVE